MSTGWQIAKLEEAQLPQQPGSPSWASLRRHFNIRSFGVNAWTATEAGQDVIGEHDEASGAGLRHEELYVVMSGRATFTVDGETFEATPGTIVFVRDPAAKRKAVGEEAGTTILAVGAARGIAFTPSEWELSAPALPYFATKEYDKALELLTGVLQEHPDAAAVLYNLACAESMSGRTAEAIKHLGRSVEMSDRFREFAQTDPDFDPIRDEPEFQKLFS